MPTRPSRRGRCQKPGAAAAAAAAPRHPPPPPPPQFREDRFDAGAPFTPRSFQNRVPTPLDCSIGPVLPPAEPYEVDVGPLPHDVEPGHIVTFDFMGRDYEAIVPDGCEPGGYFHVAIDRDSTYGGANDSKIDGLEDRSDRSTCADEYEASSEEDPMWSTDWTVHECSHACSQSPIDMGHNTQAQDGCVEQCPDSVGFENYEDEQQLVEVFELSDVSTWFTRLRQRREQALRAGKTKLVRKIDRQMDVEVDKSRDQSHVDAQIARCSGCVDKEELELEGVWGEDWTNLPDDACRSN